MSHPDIQHIDNVFFLGIGGIGMSALARYFLLAGKNVGGYDATPTNLTQRLAQEGATVLYDEAPEAIPPTYREAQHTLVVLTPAIPQEHASLQYFRQHGFHILKRAAVLGLISRAHRCLCVAGTHGKTTVSTMLAHLMMQREEGCTAFLGGISKNYHTNFLYSSQSDVAVIEADEYDRSFHQLSPFVTVITSMDADHPDIYPTYHSYVESFEHYTHLIRPGGVLLLKHGVNLTPHLQPGVRQLTYGEKQGDFHAENLQIENESLYFDFVSPKGRIPHVKLGVPIMINVENAVAAMAMAQIEGLTPKQLKNGMESFQGVERRFDLKLHSPQGILYCDYAHHPAEIANCIRSLRLLYPGRKITGIFQPHLFSRTQELYKEFAQALSGLSEVILLPIYPAREQPIAGVTSTLILQELPQNMPKTLAEKQEVVNLLKQKNIDILVLLGAGDIVNLAEEICTSIEKS